MSINNYIGDELAQKVKYFHMALNQANKTISILEEENQVLKKHLLALEKISVEKKIAVVPYSRIFYFSQEHKKIQGWQLTFR